MKKYRPPRCIRFPHYFLVNLEENSTISFFESSLLRKFDIRRDSWKTSFEDAVIVAGSKTSGTWLSFLFVTYLPYLGARNSSSLVFLDFQSELVVELPVLTPLDIRLKNTSRLQKAKNHRNESQQMTGYLNVGSLTFSNSHCWTCELLVCFIDIKLSLL